MKDYESYAEYIMDNCHGDRLICNGDTLVDAMESNYLREDFEAFMKRVGNYQECEE